MPTAAVPVSATTGGSFSPFSGFLAFVERLAAARRCAAAIKVDRRPESRDLAVLGLETMNFGNLPR